MATGSDVRDILQLEDQPTNFSRREVLFGADKPKRKSHAKPAVKKPEGLSREVWGLLYSDSRDPPPIVPTDNAAAGYKQAKIKLGVQRVRPWAWTPFVNPARKDGLVLNHWRRVADEGKEYPFAKFNKESDIPNYSDSEYAQHLHDENWSKEETDHLFDLASRFDLRFVIMQDRYDIDNFSKRSVEDLKERYYEITGKLQQIRSSDPGEQIYVFDADHERKRKEQLRRLCDRTPEEIEEEQSLIAEMRKIKQREKDREKRTGDIQKLLSKAADVTLSPAAGSGRGGASATGNKGSVSGTGNDSPNGATNENRRGPDGKKSGHHKKKGHHSSPHLTPKSRAPTAEATAAATTASSSSGSGSSAATSSTKESLDTSTTLSASSSSTSTNSSTAGIRFSEYKTSGVTLRSQRIKLPSSVGQKKTKAIESMLSELGIEANPMPTEEIGDHFNDLRSEMVLHYDLKSALQNSEFEVQTLLMRKQAILGGGGGGGGGGGEGEVVVKTEDGVAVAAEPDAEDNAEEKGVDEVKTELAESVGTSVKKPGETPETPTQKKRKAFLEQKNIMNKLKNR